jgi:hypothetical protein
VSEHTSYYRSLAEAVLRAWEHPTSPQDRVFQFLDFGLTYGPSENWPDLLTEAWAVGSMPAEEEGLTVWPVDANMEKLVEHCREYLTATGLMASRQGLSMGARVEQAVCTICGRAHGAEDLEHELPIQPLMTRGGAKHDDFKVGQVKFLYATITKAPPCDACGDAMTPVSASEWACQNESCDQQGNPLVTGVYPIQQVEDDPR